MIGDKAAMLSRVPLFGGLGPEELRTLAQLAVEKRYDAGVVLFSEGEECAGMYIVVDGSVKIYKTAPSGREMTIAVEHAPSTVAELPMFDHGPYPASVAALEPVRALFVEKRGFFQLCRSFPEVPLMMLGVIGRRLRHLVATLESVTFGSIRQRLAHLLLELRDRAGADEFPLAMTHQELASRLGTVREVVSRNLSRFQAEGLLRIEGRALKLLNPEGLEQEATTEL